MHVDERMSPLRGGRLNKGQAKASELAPGPRGGSLGAARFPAGRVIPRGSMASTDEERRESCCDRPRDDEGDVIEFEIISTEKGPRAVGARIVKRAQPAVAREEC